MPSRAKRRKIELAKTPAPTTTAKLADVTYRELYNAIVSLGQLHKKQHAELELLAENIAEVSLRVRYIMQHFKFEKGSPIVGLDGRTIPGEIATLFDRYNAERDRFLDSLAREMQPHDQAPDSHAGAEGGEPTGAASHVNGHASDAAPQPGPRLVPQPAQTGAASA